jgi:hypothetical protein
MTEHLLTMSMLITGILRGRQVQLRKIAEKVAYVKKQTSLVEQSYDRCSTAS